MLSITSLDNHLPSHHVLDKAVIEYVDILGATTGASLIICEMDGSWHVRQFETEYMFKKTSATVVHTQYGQTRIDRYIHPWELSKLIHSLKDM